MSIQIGHVNSLPVTKIVDFGVYLDGGDETAGGWGEILLPARYAPADCEVGNVFDVFIYFDSEDRIIATTETPKARTDEFAYLKAVDVNNTGAFLDWGLPKDLLVPYSQQTKRMRKGAYYLVYVFQDEESERLTASSKISKFLNKRPLDYLENEKVDLIIMAETDFGFKAIINHQHTGIIYRNEIFQTLHIGQQLTGHIKKIREDNKIDLRLSAPEKSDLTQLEQIIMSKLTANHGVLKFGDKTEPEIIYQAFSVSKKNFKRALSRLYKNRLIEVENFKITVKK